MPNSWSELTTFMSCNRKWELSYVEGLQKKPSREYANRYRGQAFHTGIADFIVHRDIEQAVKKAQSELIDMTVLNKLVYSYEDKSYAIDTEYYELMEELRTEVTAILRYQLPLIPTNYRVVTTGEFFNAEGDAPMIEYRFDYSSPSGNIISGFVDAVLHDGTEYIVVDWKLRKSFPFDEMALIDGQIHLYSAVLNELSRHVGGHSITGAIMWQFSTSTPKPARINKDGTPSVAVQDTTWDHWCATLPVGIKAEKYEAEIRPKLKENSDYVRLAVTPITDVSSNQALDNAEGIIEAVTFARSRLDSGRPLPASLGSHSCQFCDFVKLCSVPFRFGGDATEIIETEYDKKVSQIEPIVF